MSTDPAALANEVEDNENAVWLLYYSNNNSDRLFSAEECQQIAAALRQYADPRTALALRLLEEMRAAEPVPCERNHCNGCKDPNGPRAAEAPVATEPQAPPVPMIANPDDACSECLIPRALHETVQDHDFQCAQQFLCADCPQDVVWDVDNVSEHPSHAHAFVPVELLSWPRWRRSRAFARNQMVDKPRPSFAPPPPPPSNQVLHEGWAPKKRTESPKPAEPAKRMMLANTKPGFNHVDFLDASIVSNGYHSVSHEWHASCKDAGCELGRVEERAKKRTVSDEARRKILAALPFGRYSAITSLAQQGRLADRIIAIIEADA